MPVISAWSSRLRGISVGWKVMGMTAAAIRVPACWVRPPMPAFGDLMPSLLFVLAVQYRRRSTRRAVRREVRRATCGIRT